MHMCVYTYRRITERKLQGRRIHKDARPTVGRQTDRYCYDIQYYSWTKMNWCQNRKHLQVLVRTASLVTSLSKGTMALWNDSFPFVADVAKPSGQSHISCNLASPTWHPSFCTICASSQPEATSRNLPTWTSFLSHESTHVTLSDEHDKFRIIEFILCISLTSAVTPSWRTRGLQAWTLDRKKQVSMPR
jgi:hypothetical protein